MPAAEASVQGNEVRVPYTKDLVKDAPNVAPDGEIAPEEEDRLYAHYSMGGGHQASTVDRDDDTASTTTGRGVVGNDVSGPETDEDMTRSEERLRVGKEQQVSETVGKEQIEVDGVEGARGVQDRNL